MSEMTLAETADRWTNGLKKAASRCRELGKAQGKSVMWDQIADSLDKTRTMGETVIVTKALSRSAVLESMDRRSKEVKH